MSLKEKLIYVYLLILPIVDLATSLMTRFGNFPISVGTIIKGIALLLGVCYIVFISKSKWKKKSLIYLGILTIYFIIYFILKREIWLHHSLVTELINAFKYFYFLVILLTILNLFDDFKIENDKVKKIFLITSFIYSALLLIPVMTNSSFSSYPKRELFAGENGWFYAANETGAITVLLLLGTNILLDGKYSILGFVPVLLGISLIGTKVSFFGMIIAIITISIFYFKDKKDFKKPLILLTMLVIISFFSPAMANLKNKKVEIEESGFNYKVDDYIQNEFLRSTVKLFLNGREGYLINDMLIYKDVDLSHKLLGLGWSDYISVERSFDYYNKTIEIDYMDIFFRYGVFGFIIYLVPLIYLFIDFIRHVKTKETYYYFIFVILAILISSVAGHVFVAPAVSIYLSLILYMLTKSYKIV